MTRAPIRFRAPRRGAHAGPRSPRMRARPFDAPGPAAPASPSGAGRKRPAMRADASRGLPAGAELHQSRLVLAPPREPHGLPVRRLLPGDRPHPGGREVRPRLLRRPAVHAGPLRQRPPPHRRARHPLREARPGGGADHDGGGDHPPRPRLHGLHHLLRALPRRPRLPDARPDERRARGVEHRHLAERRRGGQHGPRRDHGARPALRPRRRVRGGGARPLGRLGGRRADRRQGVGPLRRRRQGPPAGLSRAASFPRAGPSPCRARRRAIRC